MNKFEKDPFRAGAALVYGKSFDNVSREERQDFKEAFFGVLNSDRFIGLQAPYVQEALRKQEEEFRALGE